MPRNLKSKRIVIKIGTNVLTDRNGLLDLGIVKSLVSQIAEVKNKRDLMIITSGAIGAGMQELGVEKPKDVVSKQVCAAVGQGILMSSYHSIFKKHGIKIAQILLTYNDLANEETLKNLKNSLNRLFGLGVIPIINENDPISINEIGPSFGDNDNLSAMIAVKMKADVLVILTNVEGLFTKNPSENGAEFVKEVKKIGRKTELMASGSSGLGIGGMKTKVQAAKAATGKGVSVIIANGRKPNVLAGIVKSQDIGTLFYPKG